MQVDTIRCSNCNLEILQKCIMIHERACFKKIIQQKPQQGFFSKLFEKPKQHPKQEEEEMIPCTECGESVPFSVFALHQEQCVGNQLMKCEQCKILFPIFLFDEHLQVCTGPKIQPPIGNAIFNLFKEPEPQMNIRQNAFQINEAPRYFNNPQKVERMIAEDEESDDEELAQMIGQLARTEIENAKLKDEPLKPQELKKLQQRRLKQSEECSICCCEMKKYKNHVRLNCAHTFHKKCIFSWLGKNPMCPMCRQHALKE